MRILMLGSGSLNSTLSFRLKSFAHYLGQNHDLTIMVPKLDKYTSFKPGSHTTPNAKVIHPFQFATPHTVLNMIPYIIFAALHVMSTKYDLIIIYKPTPVTLIGLLGKLLRRTPVILDQDDLGADVMSMEGRPAPLVALVKWSEALAARHASTIIVASTYLEQKFVNAYPGKPVLWLPNGVEPSEYTVSRSQEPMKVVFLGALNRIELLKPLLEAWPKVLRDAPNLQAVIMGDGTSRAELQDLVHTLHIEDSITFVGWVEMYSAQENMNAGDIGYCYMPNDLTIAAASNMKVFQYMAVGVVPVVSRVGDLPLYVADGEAGYVIEPGNFPALADGILQAYHNPAERAKKSDLAISRVGTLYQWSVLAQKLSKVVDAYAARGSIK